LIGLVDSVYRVSYSPERLSQIGEEAAKKGSAFSLEDRVGLVSDAMVLAKAGYAKQSAGLDLLARFKEEEEQLVWAGIGLHLGNLNKVHVLSFCFSACAVNITMG